MAESVISGMEPTLRQRYQQLLTTNQQLQNGMQQLQSQLDMLGSRKSALENQLRLSQVNALNAQDMQCIFLAGSVPPQKIRFSRNVFLMSKLITTEYI